MKALFVKKETLLRKINDCSDFLRGSITSVCSTCSRANCICTSKPTGRAYRLTYKNKQQKTRTVYITHAQLPEARKMLSNYSGMRELLDELFEINIAILKKKSKV
ncbi:MAG: hypothetical protein KQH59_22005 [Desulfobulbaceae bacterium]|nr:hypothetical protein [Desulfobulbaceae bacterium]